MGRAEDDLDIRPWHSQQHRTQLSRGLGSAGMRADTDYIVTEHGVAELRHKDIDQKAEALTAVATSEFRETLERSWSDPSA